MIERSLLPFKYVAKYDEQLIPEFPAVMIQPGQFSKELHGTHTYLHELRATIYVLHSNLNEGKQLRSVEDLRLATALVELIESNPTLGTYIDPDTSEIRNRVIYGMIESELPAALPPRSELSDVVIGTRLTYIGVNQSRFK